MKETINVKVNIDSKEAEKSLQKIIDKLSGVSSKLNDISRDLSKVSTKDLFEWTKSAIELNDNLAGKLKNNIEIFKKQSKAIEENRNNTNKWKDSIDIASSSLSGLAILGTGLYSIKDSMKNISDEGFNLSNTLGLVSGGIETIASGAQLGSIFGPVGTIIGGVGGALLGLVGAMDNYTEKTPEFVSAAKEQAEISSAKLQSYKDEKKALEDNILTIATQSDYHLQLLDELDRIVDKNGKVKNGYEERAKFILGELNDAYDTEYKSVDGVIEKYDELDSKIKKIIQTKKAEIILKATEDSYIDAIKNQSQAWYDYTESRKEYESTENRIKQLEKEKEKLALESGPILTNQRNGIFEATEENLRSYSAYLSVCEQLDIYNEKLKENRKTMSNNKEFLENYTNDISFYESLKTAILNDNIPEQERIINDWISTVETAHGKERLSLGQQIAFEEDSADKRIEIYRQSGGQITEDFQNQLNSHKNILIDSLIEQSKTINDSNDDIVDEWCQLAANSKEGFLEAFSKLPTDLQEQVIDKMQKKGYSISEELQKGITKLNPNIEFSHNINTIIRTLNNAFSKQNQALAPFGIELFKTIPLVPLSSGGAYTNGFWQNIPQYANGGLPNHGTMFIAGERGAEIVGHINGRTEVLNRSQIASSIYTAVATAMSQYSTKGQDIRVYAEEGLIVEKVSKGINQYVKQTGSLPFVIPI